MNNTDDYQNILFNVNFISTSTLTVICLIGNPLIIYIFLKPEFQKVPMFNYLIALAVVNTIHLLINWPLLYPNSFLINQNSISCKLFNFIVVVPFEIAPWLLTLSSADRYLSVKYPTTQQTRKKFINQFSAIMFVTVITLLINVPNFVYHDIEHGSGCTSTSDDIKFKMDMFTLLFATLVPFVLMVLSTTLIWNELVKKRHKLGSEREERAKYRKEVKLIRILSIIDGYFLVCNLPYGFVIILDYLGMISFPLISFSISRIFAYIFSSCDFFVYFCFNKLFRKHFLAIIRFNYKKLQHKQVKYQLDK